MHAIKEIEKAVANLSRDELSSFREWFGEFHQSSRIGNAGLGGR